MNTAWAAVAAAAVFVWLGMVLAISFLEAPLKFRAPDVSVRIGLGIGRLVFRALNRVEAVLAVVVIAAVTVGAPSTAVVVLTSLAAALLVVQLAGVRPALDRRSDRVLAGEEVPLSRAHLLYVACEVAKALTLLALGTATLMP
ncbi:MULTISPECIES: hypothetical protein [unclassified Streptomyces]|uniref:hypothetical protein n=1 Tax=unclassified Streptomyces TaxID=2593676 RepID=UPI002E3413FC|nr:MULTISPECIES: hypothetical protein [unclassified Streptomyces]WUC68088.1 hypothetical protein OG861_29740 [Streptomyces sp. NBC_00539]